MRDAQNTKSLLIGATGQTGRRLAALIGHENVVASSSSRDDASHLKIDLGDLPQDALKMRQLLLDHQIGAIYCLGGATHAERCELEPEWAMQLNCHGPAAIAALATDIPFVYYSSEYVFDGKAGPYDEDASVNPLSAYGRSKVCGERAITNVHPNPIIIRTTVVYGPDKRHKNFLYAMHRELSAGKIFPVPTDQISTPTYNLDLAQASYELVKSGARGIFHVSGPEAMTRHEFALRTAKLLGYDTRLIVPAPSSRVG